MPDYISDFCIRVADNRNDSATILIKICYKSRDLLRGLSAVASLV